MSARLIALSIVLALAACGEKAQTAGQASTKKSDAKAWEGATSSAYTDSGWKAGDKDSWEAHLKTRAQQGQNEYNRSAAAVAAMAAKSQ